MKFMKLYIKKYFIYDFIPILKYFVALQTKKRTYVEKSKFLCTKGFGFSLQFPLYYTIIYKYPWSELFWFWTVPNVKTAASERDFMCDKTCRATFFFSSLASLAWLSSGNVWVERVCKLETLIKLSSEDITK